MALTMTRLKQGLRRRWVHWQNNRHLAGLARQVVLRAPTKSGQPVVFFNASTRLGGLSQNAGFCLLASWAVRLAGVPVIHFACRAGLGRCVLGTNRDDLNQAPPCNACMNQTGAVISGVPVRWLDQMVDAHLAAALEDCSLAQLMEFTYQGVRLGALVLPSLRWVLRRHTLADDVNVRWLFRQYLLAAWNVRIQFAELLDEVKPRAVVVFNGTFYPEAAARQVARERNIPVYAHEVALRPLTAYFTAGEATAYPIDIPADFELNSQQAARLDEYLGQRLQGNFSMAGIRFWPEMRPLSEDFWQRARQFKQIVPVFTNVIFDTSQGHANVVFEHMFAWLDEVLKLIRAHPETFFVIRAHPDESRPGKEARESVAGWVAQSGAAALSNVLFVDSSEYFSSYELIQHSKFVMVYNSTIGLEASLMRAAVLCAGKARFTQLPTVFFPQSVEAFTQQAEAFLSAEQIDVPEAFYQNARRFLYMQLFRTSLPLDEFLEEDQVWRGYVKLKEFAPSDVTPEHSPAVKAIVDGILHGGSFLLEE